MAVLQPFVPTLSSPLGLSWLPTLRNYPSDGTFRWAPLAVTKDGSRRAISAQSPSSNPVPSAFSECLSFVSLSSSSSHPPRCCRRRHGLHALVSPRLLVEERDPMSSSYPQCRCVLNFALRCRCEVSPCPGPQNVLCDSYPLLSGTPFPSRTMRL